MLRKRFIILFLGVNAIKLLSSLMAERRNKLVFVHGRSFQPSLMFAGKAGSYPRGENNLAWPLER
jgi:hypothetical protein